MLYSDGEAVLCAADFHQICKYIYLQYTHTNLMYIINTIFAGQFEQVYWKISRLSRNQLRIYWTVTSANSGQL